MKERYVPHFILVDDDPINNILTGKLIETQFPNAIIRTFIDAREGLQYLSTDSDALQKDTVLFLDINMPEVDGWEFLHAFNQLPQALQKHVTIYMLSSSVAPMDKERALSHPCVTAYFTKPLTKRLLLDVLSGARSTIPSP